MGTTAALAGSMTVAVGHFVVRRGVVSRSWAIESSGIFLIVVCATSFDLLATLWAPRAVVSPIGALVVVWNILIFSWIERKRPTLRNVAAAATVFVGAVLTASSSSSHHSVLNQEMYPYTVGWALLTLAWYKPWTLGGYNGTLGPFLASFLSTRSPRDAVAVFLIATTHLIGFRRMIGRRNPAEVAPTYIAATSCSGSVAGIVAFGGVVDPLFLIGLAAVAVGGYAVNVERVVTTTPISSQQSKSHT